MDQPTFFLLVGEAGEYPDRLVVIVGLYRTRTEAIDETRKAFKFPVERYEIIDIVPGQRVEEVVACCKNIPPPGPSLRIVPGGAHG